MSEEIYGMVQILELSGKAAGGLFKGIRLSANGAKKGAELAQLKRMQKKMKVHYASQGKHETMKVTDLEKITGGEYGILNIPFENEKDLIGFYDRLKNINVSFAELPDLNIGDGYTQIAYNPQEAGKIKVVVEYYKEKMEIEAAEISLEKYEQMGGERGKKLLDELAAKGYEKETHMQHLQRIRDRNKDMNYRPVSINIDTLLIQERPDSYLCYIPHTGRKEKIILYKEDCVLIDKGQTIYTHLRKDNPEHQKFFGKFNKVKPEKIKQSERIRLSDTDAMPNFNMGQEKKEAPVPKDSVRENPKVNDKKPNLEQLLLSRNVEQNVETIQSALYLEGLKEKVSNPEYVPITFVLENSLVAETKNIYVVKLPGTQGENTVEMLTIPKKDAILSEDKKSIQTFIKKDEKTEISRHDVHTGKATAKSKIENIDLIDRMELTNKKSPVQAKDFALKEFQRKSTDIPKIKRG